MPEPTAPTRRHAPAAERRAQILDAALQCFSEKSYHTATMDDLVRASGLSKGSLYWHFRSKEEVFLALFEDFAEAFFADWDELLAGGGSALEVMRVVVVRSIERLGEDGRLTGVWSEFLSHGLARERFADLYRRVRDKMRATLERDIGAGRMRDLPVEGIAAALTAVSEGLFLQAVVDPDFDIREHWPVAWEMVCRGLER